MLNAPVEQLIAIVINIPYKVTSSFAEGRLVPVPNYALHRIDKRCVRTELCRRRLCPSKHMGPDFSSELVNAAGLWRWGRHIGHHSIKPAFAADEQHKHQPLFGASRLGRSPNTD